MASRNAMVMMGWALWCLARPGFAEVGTAQVIQVEKSEVVFNAGRREGLVLDAEVNLLRLGSPIVHPLTGQVLGRPQEPVGLARIFEVGEHQSRAVLEKSYTVPQVGDAVEYEPSVGHAAAETVTAVHGHEAEAKPLAEAPRAGAGHGKAVAAEGEVQQRLKELEQSVADYHTSSKTLRAYPVFAQRVWDEISSMKSYLVSMDERLVQLEEQQSQDRHHLSSVLGGDTAGGEEGMREFTIRYAPDTQVKLKVAGKTLVISVDHDSLRVRPEGEPAAEAGVALESHGAGTESVHSAEPEVAGEEHQSEPAGEHGAAEEHHVAAEVHAAEGEATAQTPWYQSPWVLGIGVLALGLVAGLVSWLIKRHYENKSEELEADLLEDEEEDEDED